MVLVVHHLNDSRSQRVLWLLEELEIPYEIKTYKRAHDMQAPPELKAVHPTATAPVVTDGDITLAESGSIVEYILRKYNTHNIQLSETGQVHNSYFAHYAEGSLMPILINKYIFTTIPEQAPFILRPFLTVIFTAMVNKMITPRIKVHADFIESHLEKTGDWFAGGDGPTAADYMMIFPLEAWAKQDSTLLGPYTREYVKRIHVRPAYQRSIEKGGPYAYA